VLVALLSDDFIISSDHFILLCIALSEEPVVLLKRHKRLVESH